MSTTFTIYREITFERDFAYTADGDPVDLSSDDVLFEIYSSATSAAPIFSIATDDATTALGSYLDFTDRANGEFSLKITDEETATFGKFNEGRFTLKLKELGGDTEPLIKGTAKVLDY